MTLYMECAAGCGWLAVGRAEDVMPTARLAADDEFRVIVEHEVHPKRHLSLLCRLHQDEDHEPCSGTCDCCEQPRLCECRCHD